ncbi:hypothetical protein C8J55DRAFT_526464 [Lentinula edodes]|uniref:DUF6533 domain-containing protein n=1 Tax=Lentinula lateritia TaxID=40482 RepID=A0A9W8ZUF7_9AGAR|nr:hypothetical protein C8J55DRAFT_526464 [Lentinula edodes]
MDLAQTVSLVSLTLLYYDYFLTIEGEVNLFWTYRSLTWAPVMFYLTRYFSILGSIPIMLGHFSLGHVKLCLSFQTYHQYYSLALQMFIGVLLLLRTYALFERNFKVLVLLVVVGLALVIFGIVVLAWGRNEIQFTATVTMNQAGCRLWLDQRDASCLALVWGGMLLFDFLVFSLTFYKALTLQRDGRMTLLSVLMRDGTIYFGVMAISNIGNILTFLLGSSQTRGMATTFANSISSIMISRLMFNLRDPRLSSASRPSLRSLVLPPIAVPTLDSECLSFEGHATV